MIGRPPCQGPLPFNETSHVLTPADSQVAPEFHVPPNPRVLNLCHLSPTPGELHAPNLFGALSLKTPASPRPPDLPPRFPSPGRLQPPALGALTGLALLPPGAGRRRGRCGAATSLQLVRWGRRRGGHGVGDLGQRRRRGTDAPSARTIAERGSRGQHKPPRCGHSERGEGQGPSRSAKCALAPASPPARGSSHRNRNSARPPPRSRRGGTGRDAPRAPRGRTVPLHDGGGAPHGAGTRASHPGRAAAARCLRAGPYHPRPGGRRRRASRRAGRL